MKKQLIIGLFALAAFAVNAQTGTSKKSSTTTTTQSSDMSQGDTSMHHMKGKSGKMHKKVKSSTSTKSSADSTK